MYAHVPNLTFILIDKLSQDQVDSSQATEIQSLLLSVAEIMPGFLSMADLDLTIETMRENDRKTEIYACLEPILRIMG